MLFWGLAAYYQRFVPDFASIVSHLSDLTRKGEPEKVCWTPVAEAGFQALKTALTSSTVLWIPDFQRPFLVHLDASEMGLGAMLSEDFEGEEHPIVHISQKLTPTKKRYMVVE